MSRSIKNQIFVRSSVNYIFNGLIMGESINSSVIKTVIILSQYI